LKDSNKENLEKSEQKDYLATTMKKQLIPKH